MLPVRAQARAGAEERAQFAERLKALLCCLGREPLSRRRGTR